jgi:hypothetical protein
MIHLPIRPGQASHRDALDVLESIIQCRLATPKKVVIQHTLNNQISELLSRVVWVSGWPFFLLSSFLIEEKSRWERRVYLSVVSVSGGVCAMRLKLKGPHNI